MSVRSSNTTATRRTSGRSTLGGRRTVSAGATLTRERSLNVEISGPKSPIQKKARKFDKCGVCGDSLGNGCVMFNEFLCMFHYEVHDKCFKYIDAQEWVDMQSKSEVMTAATKAAEANVKGEEGAPSLKVRGDVTDELYFEEEAVKSYVLQTQESAKKQFKGMDPSEFGYVWTERTDENGDTRHSGCCWWGWAGSQNKFY